MEKGILPLDQVSSLAQKKEKKVLVGGCFDLFHYGHFTFLKNAKEQGEILIIALEPDEFIKLKKNREPVHTQEQRAEILSALQFVDYVIMLPLFTTDQEYFELVKKIRPQIIAVTEDDTFMAVKKKYAAHVGAEVKVVTPLMANFSSSTIINKS